MTDAELMDALAACRPEWQTDDPELPYVRIAGMGRDVVAAAPSGAPWLAAVFAVVEDALTRGDSLARNLVVVGLFECMQGRAYRFLDPPDALDAWLGRRSLQAWHDLIEGWTGPGIRSIAHWQRVVVNGPALAIRWQTASGWDEVDLEQGSLRWEDGARALTEAERVDVAAAFCPLVAEALVPAPPDPVEVERIVVRKVGRTQELRLLGAIGPRVVGTDGTRWFLVDREALRWRWPAR